MPSDTERINLVNGTVIKVERSRNCHVTIVATRGQNIIRLKAGKVSYRNMREYTDLILLEIAKQSRKIGQNTLMMFAKPKTFFEFVSTLTYLNMLH